MAQDLAATSSASLPIELWYEICGRVIAEYLDALIAGDLSYPPSHDLPEADDPALGVPNPVIPLLQTSRVARRGALMVLSDALGIALDDTTAVGRLAVKPCERVFPVRLRVWRARTSSYDINGNVPPASLTFVSEAPLLRTYERMAYLIEAFRTSSAVREDRFDKITTTPVVRLTARLTDTGVDFPELEEIPDKVTGDFKADITKTMNDLPVLKLLAELQSSWITEIPQEVLRTFAYGRLVGIAEIGNGCFLLSAMVPAMSVIACRDMLIPGAASVEHLRLHLSNLTFLGTQFWNRLDELYMEDRVHFHGTPMFGEHDFDINKLVPGIDLLNIVTCDHDLLHEIPNVARLRQAMRQHSSEFQDYLLSLRLALMRADDTHEDVKST